MSITATAPLPTPDPATAGHPPRWVLPTLAVLSVALTLGADAEFFSRSIIAILVLAPALILLIVRAPGLALLGLGASYAFLGLTGSPPTLGFLLATSTVLFGAAAYGRRLTVAASGALVMGIPAGLFMLVVLRRFGLDGITSFLNSFQWSQVNWALGSVMRQIPTSAAAAVFLIVLLPWLLGWGWRSVARSRQEAAFAAAERDAATRETAYAQEVAHLRAGQTQLARDVHDVVGHSLAVILAQAQSAQYLGDDEVAKMRETLENVADSARRSLGDVRSVLTGTRQETPAASAGLDSLIAGVRAAGNEVIERVEGEIRPLSPELDQVAYRVLQEMLTNALKHGRKGGPVWVRQIWPADAQDQFTIDVHNLIDAQSPAPGDGIGLGSMRDRLASIGGSLHTSVEESADGPMFGALARLPLRAAEVTTGDLPAPRAVAG